MTTINLTHKEDFWGFYMANQAAVDSIIDTQCRVQNKYGRIENGDLKSEVILKLNNSSFLTSWDSEKSPLHVHFTATVAGAVRHALRTSGWMPAYISGTGKTHREKERTAIRWTRVDMAGVNVPEDAEEGEETHAAPPCAVDAEIEESLEGNLFMEEQVTSMFIHNVGISTFKQGFAIPKKTQLLTSPVRGGKRPVTILFGNNMKCVATLRTLDNSVNRVQVRYEGLACKTLRYWLSANFAAKAYRALEVAVINQTTIKLTPVVESENTHQVKIMVLQGYTTKEIAVALKLSRMYVNSLRTSLLEAAKLFVEKEAL